LLCGVDRLHGVPGKFSVLVCTACGSGRTLPLVGSQELHTLYPDDYNAFALPANPALRALATALFRSRYRRSLRGGALATLRTREPGRLLDVGSGRGDLGLVLRERGWQVTGLEPSADAVEHARARGIETVQGTLTGGAAVGSGYDAVVFNHSLEHVVEPLEDLQAAWAVLSDGGVLVVSGPNFGSWQRRRFEESWFHLDLPRHRSHFTRAGLERLLARVGYGEIATSTTTSADGLPMSLQYRAFGRRALDSGVGRYAFVGATLLATPVTATVGRVAGEGDLLHAVAVKEGFSRGG
jgi:SAM-dependent methyltransferase